MNEQKIIMPEITEEYLVRIDEIRFYLLINSFVEPFSPRDKRNYLNTVCSILEVNQDVFSFAESAINSDKYKPSKYELAVALRYMGIPLRIVKKEYMHPDTYYKYIEEFVANGGTGFKSKFEEDDIMVSNSIVKFIKGYVGISKILTHIDNTMGCGIENTEVKNKNEIKEI